MKATSSFFKTAANIWNKFKVDNLLTDVRLVVELNKRLLNFFQVGDYYYFIVDLRKGKFEFVSAEIADVLGYDPGEVTIPYFMSLLHPEDIAFFLNFEEKTVQFFSTDTVERLTNYKCRYDYRVQKKDGTYIRVLQQIITLQFTPEEDILRVLNIHTDITHLKEEGTPLLSFIGLNGYPSYINVEVENIHGAKITNIVSKRELQVLIHLANGKTTREISNLLYISEETVNKHRKNMLKKTGTANTAILVKTAVREGWI